MQSCNNVDAFAKVRHTSTGFPIRCDRILICDKDIEIRTYVLLKKGQTATARKKVRLPRFSCRTPKFEE